jgi:hypothetical protein
VLFPVKPCQCSIIMILVSHLLNVNCLDKLLVELELAE